MNSANKIDYETRPCKYTERRMLLASLSRIIGAENKKYQYIGFGGLSFVDFKLFHRELQITKMTSIEGGNYSYSKLKFNKPFSCIEILQGRSCDVLNNIDFTIPCIIWLDYDDTLSLEMFQDIEILLMSIPIGSVYIMSCNRQLQKSKGEPYNPEQLEEAFPGLVPGNLDANCCTDTKASETICKMLKSHCDRIVRNRNLSSQENLAFHQIYNIKYDEIRGARMYTFGGIIEKSNLDLTTLNIQDFDFIATNIPYNIQVPILTDREVSHLNHILDNESAEKELVSSGILDQEVIHLYKKYYKFLPSFHDVRI